MQAYQREPKPIQDIYAQATRVFATTHDLVEDFKEFLPETVANTNQGALARPGEPLVPGPSQFSEVYSSGELILGLLTEEDDGTLERYEMIFEGAESDISTASTPKVNTLQGQSESQPPGATIAFQSHQTYVSKLENNESQIRQTQTDTRQDVVRQMATQLKLKSGEEMHKGRSRLWDLLKHTCARCRARKTICNGQTPCRSCFRTGSSGQCVYANLD